MPSDNVHSDALSGPANNSSDGVQVAPPAAWHIFMGDGTRTLADLPAPPPWRRFGAAGPDPRAVHYQPEKEEVDMVNAALYLRRPLLITGKPGAGKSSLARAVAYHLGLGPLLIWPITSRTTLNQGLYRYDAIGRLQAAALQNEQNERALAAIRAGSPLPQSGDSEAENGINITRYLNLGPLGTAFASATMRVLLVDEIDKGDIDLPNDLLNIFEEGEFRIPELERLGLDQTFAVRPDDQGSDILITGGRVHCNAFPLIVLTSNGERDFPPAFLRRCLRLNIDYPNLKRLKRIVQKQLGLDDDAMQRANSLIEEFFNRQNGTRNDMATDQLLNAVYLAMHQEAGSKAEFLQRLDSALREAMFEPLR